jgi:predicted Holliday junction resolvase-like endonuclease
MEKFAIGVVVGGLCGALLATNNYKMRTLVKKGQEEVQAKLDELMDEKIQQMEEKVNETTETVKEKAKKAKDELKKTAKKAVQN